MIQDITLKFGSSSTQKNLKTDLTPITIFVGPNNSGKSKILNEIESYCKSGLENDNFLILDSVNFSQLNDTEDILNTHILNPRPSDNLGKEQVVFGDEKHRRPIAKTTIDSFLADRNSQKRMYCVYYVSLHTLRLGGESRIKLVEKKNAGNLKEPPTSMLQELFQDDNKRLEVRRIIYDAIKKYFVIDPTELGKFSIRLSDTEPKNTLEEIGVHKDAIAFHEKAMDINIASDGVKAFTGIVTTVIAGDPKIILLDEPEAFLHPSLSFTLGKEISKSIDGKTKNLFVATHSSNFLMGCIQSGVPLNIIRLTYTNNTPTARILSNDKVLKLMRHPLLRSTGVLNGLFYEFVIVTEADSDRAFYQEINERLLAFDPSRGIPNCLFLNAQNKQTIHEIIRPLREMGIPSIAIVDVDVIKEGGRNWSNLLESANIPDALIQSLNQLRKIILNYLKESDLDFKRNGGIEILNGQEETACRHLFNQLDEFGIFTVRKGELESWLKHIKIPNSKHGNTWLIEMFEKLGEDPNSASYIKPGEGDVWQFMSELKEWFLNPKRNGIPD